jgi:O-antigen/teichoic acid export membrane protein
MDSEENKETNKALKFLVNASFIVIFTTVISKILAYLYRIVIARYYGPEIYGIYSISLMVVSWVTIFVGLGFASGLIRYIPYYRGKNEEEKSAYLIKKVRIILIISGVLGSALLILFSNFISNQIFNNSEIRIFIIIFSLAIPLSALSGVYFSVLKSYEKIGWFSFIVNILQNIVKLFFLMLLIFLGFSSNSIPLSYVLGVLITFIFAYFVSKITIPQLFKNYKIKDQREVFSSLISYSWPLIFFGFISSILSWTDTFMIGIFKTTSDVGFYNAAVPLALIITLSTDLFRQMLLPLITKEYGRGNLLTVKVISRQVTKWLFIVSIPLFIFLFFFPQEFIKLFFGAEYLPATNALRLLSIGFFISSVLDVSPEILSMKGKSKIILLDIILIGTMNLILNYFLIPVYGINGAAFSTMVSVSCLNILFTFQSWKISNIFPIKRDILRVILAGLVSFLISRLLVIYVIHSQFILFIFIILFTLFYLFFLYIFHSIDRNDKMIFNAVKTKLVKLKSTHLNLSNKINSLE